MIQVLRIIFQIIIVLGIFNVWLLRFRQSTQYRGGGAVNMEEEFRVYGFGRGFMLMIGAAKIVLACLLIIGFWINSLRQPASLALALLMLGAIVMHIRVKDPVKRILPAVAMFLLCVFVGFA